MARADETVGVRQDAPPQACDDGALSSRARSLGGCFLIAVLAERHHSSAALIAAIRQSTAAVWPEPAQMVGWQPAGVPVRVRSAPQR